MNEHSFIRAVHDQLPADPDFSIWKINTKFAGGKPDCHYCGPESDLWVEYKYLAGLPARGSTRVSINLSDLQKDELGLLDRNGRPAWVVVGSPKQAVVLSVSEAIEGITTDQYKDRAVSFREVAVRIATFCGVPHENHRPARPKTKWQK